MDDASLFQKIMTTYGGRFGKPSRRLLSFLKKNGLSEDALEYISEYILKKGAGVSAVYIYGESQILETNAEDYLPVALRDGLLVVGSCPNGDPIAVDVRKQLGTTGYIDHEEIWQIANVRNKFAILSRSLGRFIQGLDRGQMPLDYDEAIKRPTRLAKSSRVKR
jgi:hypothetical protein